MQTEYKLSAADTVLQKTPVTFDVSMWELFWPLQTGARLVIARPSGHMDPAYLLEVIDTRHITTVSFVPSMLAAFTGHLTTVTDPRTACRSLRTVFAAGEALDGALAERTTALLDVELHNLYGPTETAVVVSSHRVDGAEDVS
ncbi:AMP-binding protein, partial [Nocardia araoensis]|uniref:AMP-binding protein n=1 Tax=Nocardia araoensis TaxID=228600 RepID=UPI001FDF724C